MTTAKGRAPVPDGQDSAADRTIQAITEMIISGHLNPGDRLPTERDLAQRLNVSRNTLREAIRCLEVMGIVDVRHGDGTYVTSLEPCKLLDTTGFVTRLLRDHTILEMFEVRAILECAATALAAARMTDADLVGLRFQLERLLQADSLEEILGADLTFHSLIAAASGNAMLASLLETFSATTYRARYLKSRLESEESITSLRRGHTAIYEAILSRDPEAATSAARIHVQGVIKWLQRILRAKATPDVETGRNYSI